MQRTLGTQVALETLGAGLVGESRRARRVLRQVEGYLAVGVVEAYRVRRQRGAALLLQGTRRQVALALRRGGLAAAAPRELVLLVVGVVLLLLLLLVVVLGALLVVGQRVGGASFVLETGVQLLTRHVQASLLVGLVGRGKLFLLYRFLGVLFRCVEVRLVVFEPLPGEENYLIVGRDDVAVDGPPSSFRDEANLLSGR